MRPSNATNSSLNASPARDTVPSRPEDAVRVLMIDDDTALCASLVRLLRLEGFAVDLAHTEPDGVERAATGHHALIILDVMLPGGDGRIALRKIRAHSDVPIIMLTARGDETDRIAGLEAGADDYLPKPFNARELVARMRAVLKRRVPQQPQPQAIVLGDLVLHQLTRRALKDEIELPLTGAEFDILLLLVKSAGKIVSRDEIAEVCLGRQVGPFDRSVDNHISNLRKKLGPFRDAERIRSARGAGYIYTGIADGQ